MVDLDDGHLGGVRHQEVHERRVQQLPMLVVDHPLVQRTPDALGDAAVHLPSRMRGLITVPQSWMTQYRRMWISAVSGSTPTIAACMPLANVERIGE